MAEDGEGGESKQERYPYGEYDGGRDSELNRHGWGSALLPNGDIYEGEYLHGKRHGQGMYCFKNGARYIGNWRKGLKHGQGTFLYPDGSKYVGEWKNDYKHGHGTYYYVNGDTYDGPWYKDQRHGLGTYNYKSLNVSHFGNWLNGSMEGAGIITYPHYQYHGRFSRNLPKGTGCFTFEAKYIQHGHYINVRDPTFDYVGADELAVKESGGGDADIELMEQKGIVPIWRACSVSEFNKDLLPPQPQPLLIKDSQDSLIDYLMQQQQETDALVEDEGDVPSPDSLLNLNIEQPVFPYLI